MHVRGRRCNVWSSTGYSSRDQKGTILTLAAYRKSLESPIDMGFVPLESLNPDEYDDMCFHKKIQKNPPQKKC